MSKKTEFKFGMSPLKTQKLATELVKTKPRIAKRETDRVDLEQGFGKCSLRLPKTDGRYKLTAGEEKNFEEECFRLERHI